MQIRSLESRAKCYHHERRLPHITDADIIDDQLADGTSELRWLRPVINEQGGLERWAPCGPPGDT